MAVVTVSTTTAIFDDMRVSLDAFGTKELSFLLAPKEFGGHIVARSYCRKHSISTRYRSHSMTPDNIFKAISQRFTRINL